MATKFFANYIRKASAYLRLYGWLVFDAARSAKLQVASVLVLSLIGVAARASTFGAILLFARSVESGKDVKLGPILIPVGGTFPLLLLWSGIVLGVGLISAFIIYLATAMCLRAGQNYEIKASSRILSIISTSPTLVDMNDLGDSAKNTFLRRLARTDSRFMRRAYQLILQSAIPAIQFLIWAAVLIRCDPLLTLLVVGIGIFYLIPFYLVNRSVAKYSREYESALVDSSTCSTSSVLQHHLHAQAPPDRQKQWKDKVFKHGTAGRILAAYNGRLIVRAKNDLFSDIFFGLYLACILLVFGTAVLQGSRLWADFATYIVALRLAQVGLKNFTGKISVMSRFHPQISRYRRFFRRHSQSEHCTPAKPPKLPLLLQADESPLIERNEPLEVLPGQSVLCLWPVRVNRCTLGDIIPILLRNAYTNAQSTASSVAFYVKVGNFLPGNLYYNTTGSDQCPEIRRKVEENLTILGVLDAVRALPNGLETDVSDPAVATLNREARYAIGVMPCLLSPKPFIAIDTEALMKTSLEFRGRLCELIGEKILLLFSDNIGNVPEGMDILGCAVLGVSGIAGCGGMEWYRQHRDNIAKYLATYHIREGKGIDEENLMDILVDDA